LFGVGILGDVMDVSGMAWIVVWSKKADRKFTGDLELLKDLA